MGKIEYGISPQMDKLQVKRKARQILFTNRRMNVLQTYIRNRKSGAFIDRHIHTIF